MGSSTSKPTLDPTSISNVWLDPIDQKEIESLNKTKIVADCGDIATGLIQLQLINYAVLVLASELLEIEGKPASLAEMKAIHLKTLRCGLLDEQVASWSNYYSWEKLSKDDTFNCTELGLVYNRFHEFQMYFDLYPEKTIPEMKHDFNLFLITFIRMRRQCGLDDAPDGDVAAPVAAPMVVPVPVVPVAAPVAAPVASK